MAQVPVMINGVLWDLYGRTGRPVVLMGEASIVGLEVGGGPIYPPPVSGPPGQPVHPIWGPPGFNPPGPGMPPGIWGGPVLPPPPDKPPEPEPPPVSIAVKPPPETGGWGWFAPYGWGYFPSSSSMGPKR